MENCNENEKSIAPIIDKKFMVSIDIGTAYSGCAFSDRTEYEMKPLNIVVVPATGGSGQINYEKAKQPSTILFNKDKHFHSFGYVAEGHYAAELESQKNFNDSEWFYFKQFKMCLYENKNVSRDMVIKDQYGKEMKAMDVFAAAIGYLKTETIKEIKNKKGDTPEKDIMFVLTIPAIWNEPAKQFMQEAAGKAGIPNEQLTLALEPEAAAIYCKEFWKSGSFGQNDAVIERCMTAGGRYLVLDLGGGTIDTTIHERKQDGNLIEIHKATGGPWGGCKVNDNFIDYIVKLYGKDTLLRMRQERPLDCYDLENSFEDVKRRLTSNEKHELRLKVPNRLKMYSNKEVPKHTVDHLYIQKKEFMEFFDSCVKEINNHIKLVLGKVSKVDMMLLVGGFSESEYVRHKLQSENKDMKIFAPGESSLAVMKGAILFGYKPSCITARISRYTYGIGVMRSFDPKIHPTEKKKIVDGEEYCDDIFNVLANEGTVVDIDEERKISTCNTHHNEDRRFVKFSSPLYASVNRNPVYTTDEGCTYLGKITMEPPTDGWGQISRFTHRCFFGRTQIAMKVYDEINKRDYNSTFDLLE